MKITKHNISKTPEAFNANVKAKAKVKTMKVNENKHKCDTQSINK